MTLNFYGPQEKTSTEALTSKVKIAERKIQHLERDVRILFNALKQLRAANDNEGTEEGGTAQAVPKLIRTAPSPQIDAPGQEIREFEHVTNSFKPHLADNPDQFFDNAEDLGEEE